ncbi:MAG: hypothetical protein WCK05_12510 [Planctomycetota bacterium]
MTCKKVDGEVRTTQLVAAETLTANAEGMTETMEANNTPPVSDEEQSGDVERTADEIEAKAEEAAANLLAQGGNEAKAWVGRGRIIEGFARWLQPDGRYSKPNPFKILAERKDLPWAASQLRTYRDAYVLWQKMGGEDAAPKVDATMFGMVLSLDSDTAEKILRKAAKDKLSTRDVGVLVKNAKGVAPVKVERVVGDWKALSKALDVVVSEVGLLLKNPPPCPDLDVVDRIEILFADLRKLAESINNPEGGQA